MKTIGKTSIVFTEFT